jgi:hypothetical protein
MEPQDKSIRLVINAVPKEVKNKRTEKRKIEANARDEGCQRRTTDTWLRA